MIGLDWSEALLTWYRQHGRELPWRGSRDAYAVWVSEIMLQQTRVEAVIPYYFRWMERFPDILSLAQASLQEVLAVWEGLGYYGRARNLHRSAQVVMQKHAGKIPEDVKDLQKLPGVGRYTAGAIASITFGKDEAALDGNIRRVLSRFFDVREPARSVEGEKRLWELAQVNLPKGKAGEYNQALMDLGASLCTKHAPQCASCPIQASCQAKSLGLQTERPVTRKKPVIPHYTVTAAVLERDGQVLIAQRPLNGLLGGLWEFPGGKQMPGEALEACLRREIMEELGVEIQVNEAVGVYSHAYTHFRVTLHAFSCKLGGEAQPQALQVNDLRWVNPQELHGFPMGKIDRQIADQLIIQYSAQVSSKHNGKITRQSGEQQGNQPC